MLSWLRGKVGDKLRKYEGQVEEVYRFRFPSCGRVSSCPQEKKLIINPPADVNCWQMFFSASPPFKVS